MRSRICSRALSRLAGPLLAAAVFVGVLSISHPATAQYPVTDTAGIAKYIELLKTAQDTLRTLGDATKPGTLLGSLKGAQDALGNEGDRLPPLERTKLNLTGLAPTEDRWGPDAQADWSSFESARASIRRQLFRIAAGTSAPVATPIEIQAVRAKRTRAARRATEDAAALALAARQKLAKDGAEVERLGQRADQPSVRLAVQANTDALLAVHDRMTETALLLTALIELRALQAIESDQADVGESK